MASIHLNNTVFCNIEIADTYFKRLIGLILKNRLNPGEGLLIKPCRQIHTMFMSFPIDAVFLNKNGEIIYLISNLQPGKISPYVKNAFQILELPNQTINSTNLKKGDIVKIEY